MYRMLLNFQFQSINIMNAVYDKSSVNEVLEAVQIKTFWPSYLSSKYRVSHKVEAWIFYSVTNNVTQS